MGSATSIGAKARGATFHPATDASGGSEAAPCVQRDDQVANDARIDGQTACLDKSFADHLRAVRRQLAGKQITLSTAIGCTDSAVSLWESGARLPTPRSFRRILTAVTRGGASPADILALRSAWQAAYARRSELWGTRSSNKARQSDPRNLRLAVARS